MIKGPDAFAKMDMDLLVALVLLNANKVKFLMPRLEAVIASLGWKDPTDSAKFL